MEVQQLKADQTQLKCKVFSDFEEVYVCESESYKIYPAPVIRGRLNRFNAKENLCQIEHQNCLKSA